MGAVTLLAPAKVNLHLGVYPCVDAQGYHRVDSLMVALDVSDEVEVRAGAELSVSCQPAVDVAQENNTAYKAAVALGSLVGRDPNVSIFVKKHLPSQAGLGGGSSDAAAVLRALCKLWDVSVLDERVAEAARSVGADVPFFLDPVPTLLVGRGDVVAKKFPRLAEPVPMVLVRPAGPGVSTPVAYGAFDEQHEEPGGYDELCEVLRRGEATPARIASLLQNNLGEVACRLLPQVSEALAWLRAHELVLGAQVCGSGSCLFGICATSAGAQEVAHASREHFGEGAWVRATSFC